MTSIVSPRARDRRIGHTEDRPAVLIVDDNASLVRLLATVVRRAGYQPLEASSVEEAFDLLASHRVDLVVTDLDMPGLGGLDLLAQLADDADDPPPVLVVTGTEDENTLQAAAGLGARAILAKPCALNDLTSAISGILHPPPDFHGVSEAA